MVIIKRKELGNKIIKKNEIENGVENERKAGIMKKAIVVENIGKKYGNVTALKDISFSVESGKIFGLIGPDGSGKTSLFNILTTLILPDSGKAYVDGYDIVSDYKKIRKLIGYMPGRFSLYQDLTVRENLEFFAAVFGTTIQENYDLIKDIYQQIEPFKNRRAGKLSGGMKQKLALSCALIHKPVVLFLDEPTTGVDAVSRREFWEMLKSLKQKGISIMVSTPYMDEALQCDEVAMMQGGEILSINTPQQMIKSYPRYLYGVSSNHRYHLLLDLREYEGVKTVFSFGREFHVSSDAPIDEMSLEDYLTRKGHREIKIHPIRATVEDIFMELMLEGGDTKN